MSSRSVVRTVAVVALLAVSSCTTNYIKGTRIADTPDNRQILELLNAYRSALEAKDADKIISLCSERYYEDSGTTETADDYGFNQLKDHVLKDTFAHTSELFLSLTIDDIKVEPERANVDFRFDYRAHLMFPAGDKWVNDIDFNRVELVKEGGAWKILSGL